MSEFSSIAEVVAEAGRKTAEAVARLVHPQESAMGAVAETKIEEAPAVQAEPAPEETAAEVVDEVPATDVPAVAESPVTADEAKAMTFKAVSVDDRGVIYGIGGSIARDKQDEDVEKGALIGLAYDFCARADRTFRPNHDQTATVDAELVESWLGEPVLKSGRVLAPGEAVPANDPIDLAQCRKGQETHWFMTVKPKDPAILDAARKGELVGFSWGGFARKVSA